MLTATFLQAAIRQDQATSHCEELERYREDWEQGKRNENWNYTIKVKKKNKWGSSNIAKIADLQAQRALLSILTMQGRC